MHTETAVKQNLLTAHFRRSLFPLFLFVAIAFALVSESPLNAAPASVREISDRIDELVAANLEAQGLERNEPIVDEAFVRRIYLDIAGRIPTYTERHAFLNSGSEDKRAQLIDELLESEGYVSSYYNYWADILRVKSRGRRTIMVSYQDWIKDSLRENKPYDAFVREMLTSEGYVWDDPAVGYYLRDAGMPLDNMSNTAQVFLGTRMQCAQCHDHPFDKWTQKEYYHMAAYTFGLQSQLPYGKVPLSQELQKIQRAKVQKSLRDGYTRQEARKMAQPSGAQRRVVRDLILPMTAQATEVDRELKLPEDYQYKNGRPNQKVAPKTPFGEEAIVGKKDDPREVYAEWLTSADNPRFALVIANRLWKKAMGVGLIEPVDDLSDRTEPSNPKLMEYLVSVMVEGDFDMKHYLRVVFNSRTYQSAVSPNAPEPGEFYAFQGPVLRRMTAEQLWDSLLTLAVVDLDERTGIEPQLTRARQGESQMEDRVRRLENLDTATVYGLAKHLTDLETRFLEYERDYRKKLQNASSNKEKSELRRDYRKTRSKKNQATEIMLAKLNGEDTSQMTQALYGMDSGMMGSGSLGGDEEQMEELKAMRRDPRWRGMSPNMVRASEVISPAPPGHFLREFGQSDREIIENSTQEASITQALRLLNGEAVNWLLRPNSALNANLQREPSSKRRLDVIFESFFSRPPTAKERELVGAQFQSNGRNRGYRQLLTALVNTQEFRFVQ